MILAPLLLGPAFPPGTDCELGTIPQRDTGGPRDEASASLSSDGRFLAFASRTRLLTVDTNNSSDIYVLDRSTRQLTIESLLPNGRASTDDSLHPRISGDGSRLVFESTAPLTPDMVGGGRPQIFLRDRQNGATRILSANRSGQIGNQYSRNPVISADGRVVAFQSVATNLVSEADAGDVATAIYVVDVAGGAIVRASVSSVADHVSDGASFSPGLSADGRYLVFTSTGTLDHNDLGGPTANRRKRIPRSSGSRPHAQANVFVRDLERLTTRRISRAIDATKPNGPSYSPTISGDGRLVAFVSDATDLVRGRKNNTSNVYLHALDTSTTWLVSRSVSRGAANGASLLPVVSGNGRVIAFQSEASDLECAAHCAPRDRDINLVWDVFVHDTATGMTTRLSADPHSGWAEPSRAPLMDAAGEVVVFSSRHPLDQEDRRHDFDLFVMSGCAANSRSLPNFGAH